MSAAAAPCKAEVTDGFRFAVHHGLRGLEEIEPYWNGLLSTQFQGAPFFHRPDWYRSFLCSLGVHAGAVHFVTAYRRETLVAVIPLQHQDMFSGATLRPRILGSVEHDEMQLFDFVFAKTESNAELYSSLFEWLRRDSALAWDALRLRRVPDFSALAFAAERHMPGGTRVLQHDSSAWFDTSGTYDQATASVSGTFKRNLRRLSRRAEQTAPLRHESVTAPADLPVAMQHFLAIESSSWKGIEGTSTAIALNPEMLRFYTSLQEQFGRTGDCMINLLWHGDVAVAGQFCLREESVLNVLKVGYRGTHASIAPGNLLLERMLRDCCARPDIQILSLVNHPPWARNFKPNSIPVRSYVTHNRTVRGYLVLGGLILKRHWDSYRSRAQARQQPAQSAAGGEDEEPKAGS